MRTNIIHILRNVRSCKCALLLAALFLASCSTTEKIPDGEQLYVGINKIDYNAQPQRKTKIRRDSVGVITTISDAVKVVDDALSGKLDDGLLGKLKDDAKGVLTPEEERTAERRAEEENHEANMKAFEKAKEEVEAVLAYPPNNALFGSSYHRSPLQLGLWFYNGFVDAKTKFGKWIYKSFAQQPILISSVSPEMRVKVAQNTLHNYGFFRGKVDYDIVSQKDPKKAKINYHVTVGPVTRFDSIAYFPYSQIQDSLISATREKTLLKSGEAFSVVSLAGEQERIGSLFRENGFYFWQDAFTTYQADTLQRANWAQLRVLPKNGLPQQALHPWYIGHTYIAVRRNEHDVLSKSRTRRNFTFEYSGKRLPLRPGMWMHAISHRNGRKYSYSDQKNTLETMCRAILLLSATP